MPIQEQIDLLKAAEKVAEQHNHWESLARIKLALGKKLQAMNMGQEAFQYIKDFRNLAEKSNDPHMLKMATLLMGEYYHWQGRFSPGGEPV